MKRGAWSGSGSVEGCGRFCDGERGEGRASRYSVCATIIGGLNYQGTRPTRTYIRRVEAGQGSRSVEAFQRVAFCRELETCIWRFALVLLCVYGRGEHACCDFGFGEVHYMELKRWHEGMVQ